jgi:hypothetical protein
MRTNVLRKWIVAFQRQRALLFSRGGVVDNALDGYAATLTSD